MRLNNKKKKQRERRRDFGFAVSNLKLLFFGEREIGKKKVYCEVAE